MPTPQTAAYRVAAHACFPRWLGPVLLAAAVTIAGTPNSPARAEDGILTWIVKSISSDEDGAVIRASAMQVPQEGTALATGQRISTIAGQRMVLVNGRDLVEVSANSTVTIGDNDSATTEANVDLVSGTIHVEVGKRAPGQTFSIGAPYLVATVKGTKFDVSTTSEASAVSVTQGVVAVSSIASGESVDVTVGNTAMVARRTLGAPTLAPSPAGSAPSAVGLDNDMDTASADTGNGGNDGSGGAGGSGSAGSGSGGGSS
ncbi:MAG TPA: FecR family protein, partial [Dongiaceae bacterium]|nr:FecR family protein [Dongiaceae bacterium]